jgi:hypothetical protein
MNYCRKPAKADKRAIAGETADQAKQTKILDILQSHKRPPLTPPWYKRGRTIPLLNKEMFGEVGCKASVI